MSSPNNNDGCCSGGDAGTAASASDDDDSTAASAAAAAAAARSSYTTALPPSHSLVHISAAGASSSTRRCQGSFELMPGENWLRLSPIVSGQESLLLLEGGGASQEQQQSYKNDGAVRNSQSLLFPNVLSVQHPDAFLCLDVDGPYLVVKDTRCRNSDDDDGGGLEFFVARAGESSSMVPSSWEVLPRRHARLLHEFDRLCIRQRPQKRRPSPAAEVGEEATDRAGEEEEEEEAEWMDRSVTTLVLEHRLETAVRSAGNSYQPGQESVASTAAGLEVIAEVRDEGGMMDDLTQSQALQQTASQARADEVGAMMEVEAEENIPRRVAPAGAPLSGTHETKLRKRDATQSQGVSSTQPSLQLQTQPQQPSQLLSQEVDENNNNNDVAAPDLPDHKGRRTGDDDSDAETIDPDEEGLSDSFRHPVTESTKDILAGSHIPKTLSRDVVDDEDDPMEEVDNPKPSTHVATTMPEKRVTVAVNGLDSAEPDVAAAIKTGNATTHDIDIADAKMKSSNKLEIQRDGLVEARANVDDDDDGAMNAPNDDGGEEDEKKESGKIGEVSHPTKGDEVDEIATEAGASGLPEPAYDTTEIRSKNALSPGTYDANEGDDGFPFAKREAISSFSRTPEQQHGEEDDNDALALEEPLTDEQPGEKSRPYQRRRRRSKQAPRNRGGNIPPLCDAGFDLIRARRPDEQGLGILPGEVEKPSDGEAKQAAVRQDETFGIDDHMPSGANHLCEERHGESSPVEETVGAPHVPKPGALPCVESPLRGDQKSESGLDNTVPLSTETSSFGINAKKSKKSGSVDTDFNVHTHTSIDTGLRSNLAAGEQSQVDIRLASLDKLEAGGEENTVEQATPANDTESAARPSRSRRGTCTSKRQSDVPETPATRMTRKRIKRTPLVEVPKEDEQRSEDALPVRVLVTNLELTARQKKVSPLPTGLAARVVFPTNLITILCMLIHF